MQINNIEELKDYILFLSPDEILLYSSNLNYLDGIKYSICNASSFNIIDALQNASSKGNFEIVKYILNFKTIIIDDLYDTIYYSIISCNLELFKYLVKIYLDVNYNIIIPNKRLLKFAIDNGCNNILLYMFSDMNATIDMIVNDDKIYVINLLRINKLKKLCK